MNKFFQTKKYYKQNLQKGQALLVSLVFFTFLSVALVTGLAVPVVREFKIADTNFESKRSFYLAESGIEDGYYRLKNNIKISSKETLTIDGYTATSDIIDSGYNQKAVSTTGDFDSKIRKMRVLLTTGKGVSFSYGVQSGQGGFKMDNGSSVSGSVYSNGSITGSGLVAGSASSADSPALTADQDNSSGNPLYDVAFGNSNSTQDFAQSFQVTTSGLVNKVDLYLKKVSVPSNLTVRIVADNAGSPGTTELASGTLSAKLVSTSYGWVTVPFSSNPQLYSGTTYWIVIDGVTSNSKYYYIKANSNGYPNGQGKLGQYTASWNNTNPVGLDGFFKLYTGGVTGLIDGITVGVVGVGNAYANTVQNSTIEGTNYCKSGTGNNKTCNTTLANPTQVAMPISDQNIADWKDVAVAGGTYNGNYLISGKSATLGPLKINGNLTVDINSDLTLTGVIWVTGNIDINNGSIVRLSSSYGSSEGLLITDGTATIHNNATFIGSGTPDSYVMVLSTSYSTSAISLANNGGAIILYAGNGTVDLSNNAVAKSLVGYTIHLGNNANIIYDIGLQNSNFISGPSGGWSISAWQETE